MDEILKQSRLRLSFFPGIDSWPGKQIHSHNYRVPDPFKDQVLAQGSHHYTEACGLVKSLVSSLNSWMVFFLLPLQIVIVIGSSASGVDISRDIAKVAKEVHVSSRSTSPDTYEMLPGYDNLWLHPVVLTKPANE